MDKLNFRSYAKFARFADNFKTAKARVWALYTHFPITISSDYELIKHYDFFFHQTKYHEDTVKRWGRKFREEHPDLFSRTPERAVNDYMAQEYIQKTMGEYRA